MVDAGVLSLLDYRRRVAEMYREARRSEDGETGWNIWRNARDDLFSTHPETPLDQPQEFSGLSYYPYSPSWRTVGQLTPKQGAAMALAHSDEGSTQARLIGEISFELATAPLTLDAYWIDSYGGGLFVPFRDATNADDTYGGGRYLIDTVKGADLGHEADQLVLDFNYAYHPSCFYSPRWSCPLAPAGNRLEIRVEAGERI